MHSAAPEGIAVLLAGERVDNILAALELFHDAGLAVDVISTRTRLGLSRRIRRFTPARDPAHMLRLLRQALGGGYAAIVACDDMLLGAVIDSDWSEAEKLRALPVLRREDMGHLYSKIGLSCALDRGGVPTPPYRVVHAAAELAPALDELAGPCFVKADRSAGGFGTALLESLADMDRLRPAFPVLVQRRIDGELVGIEAFYREGRLVFFAVADILAPVDDPLGVSRLRSYRPRREAGPRLRGELEALGQALGADGFANVSLIETADGERSYFEADMRPNAWIAMGRHVGEDDASRIRAACLGEAPPGHPAVAGARRVVTHFARAPFRHLLLNRYHVWSTLPRGEGPLLLAVIIGGALARCGVGAGARLMKTLLGKRRYMAVRRLSVGVLDQLARMIRPAKSHQN